MSPDQLPVAPEPLENELSVQAQGPKTTVITNLPKGQRRFRPWVWVIMSSLAAVAAIIVIGWLYQRATRSVSTPKQSQIIKPQDIDLSEVSVLPAASPVETNRVVINGQFQANDSIVLKPSKVPNVAVLGQIYFDNGASRVRFYDGKTFQTLVSQQDVVDLIAQSQAELPQDLAVTASPSFAGLALGGSLAVGGNAMVGGRNVCVAGLVCSGYQASGNYLTSADIANLSPLPQDLRTVASPQFAGLQLKNGLGGVVNLQSSASSSTLTFTLPSAAGLANQCMITDGNGILSFGNCSSGLGAAFIQGGNSFGAAGVLGTKDNYDMNIISNNTTRAAFAANGQITLQAGASMNVAFQVLGNSATAVLTVGTNYGQFGAVGIGTTGPSAKLHVVQQGVALLDSDTLKVSNSTSLGRIARFQDDSQDVMVIYDGGSILMQNSINSTSALSVKSSDGTDVLKVDTASSSVNAYGSLTVLGNVGVGSSHATAAIWITNSGAGVGVLANAKSQSSGLFQTANFDGTNSYATLVTRANSLQTADLLQAQDSSGNAIFRVTVSGDGSFTGTVSGADAISNTDFVTKQQLGGIIASAAFIQGGNSFGAAGVLGTKDNYDMNIISNNTTRAAFAANGQITLQAGASMNGAFQVLGNSATAVLTVGTNYGQFGAVGIGTTGPGAKLHVVQQGDSGPDSVALAVSNSNSLGAIAAFSDDLTDVMVIYDGGSILMQNSINSTSALSVKKSDGTDVLKVDTTNSTVTTYGGLQVNGGTVISGTNAITSLWSMNTGSGAGIIGMAASQVSGLFQTSNTIGTNSYATLVTRANTSQTADLLQAQDSSGNALYRISASGILGSPDVASAITDSRNVVLRTGNSSTSGNTGNLTLATGNAASGNSGNILIGAGSASGTSGGVVVKNAQNSKYAFTVNNAADSRLLQVDTTNSRVGINIPFSDPASALEVGGSLRLSGGQSDSFVTPQGSLVDTRINIPLFDVGQFKQVMALGIDNNAADSARVISVFDSRIGTNNQPPIAVFNVAENDLFGLGWDGGNSTAYLKAMSANIGVRSGTTDIATFLATGYVGINNTNPANRLNLNTLAAADSSAQLAVATGGISNKGIVVQGVNTQSADLFQAQSYTGAVLASISSSGALTVAGATVNGSLAVNGHIKSGNSSGSTTLTAGAAACTSPTASVSGNDTAGTVSITAGTACPIGGVLATVSFAGSFGSAPRIILSPSDTNAATIQYYNGNAGLGSFTIDTNSQLTSSQTYKFNYFVIE